MYLNEASFALQTCTFLKLIGMENACNEISKDELALICCNVYKKKIYQSINLDRFDRCLTSLQHFVTL